MGDEIANWPKKNGRESGTGPPAHFHREPFVGTCGVSISAWGYNTHELAIGAPPPHSIRFHTLTRTVDKLHTTENSFGLDGQQRRARFAVNVGDGAIKGPYGVGVGNASAQRSGLPDMPAWGALDGFHALDTAGAKVALQ